MWKSEKDWLKTEKYLLKKIGIEIEIEIVQQKVYIKIKKKIK
jgi:hypothetical protein